MDTKDKKLEELIVQLYLSGQDKPIFTKMFKEERFDNGSLTSRYILRDENNNRYFVKTYLHNNACRGNASREILLNEREVQEHISQLGNSFYVGYAEINNSLCLFFKDMTKQSGMTLEKLLCVTKPDFKQDNKSIKRNIFAEGYQEFSFEWVANVVSQMASQVQQLHDEYGIVHTDLSPDNILIVDGKMVYVNDFGIARPLGGEMKSLFNKAQIQDVGGGYYGSVKEVMRNEVYSPPDIGSVIKAEANYDTYLMSNLLCLMATGRLREYWDEQMTRDPNALKKVMREEFARPKRSSKKYTQKTIDTLTEIILKGTDADKNKRFGTAIEFRERVVGLSLKPVKNLRDVFLSGKYTVPTVFLDFEPKAPPIEKYFDGLWQGALQAYVPIVEQKVEKFTTSEMKTGLQSAIHDAKQEYVQRPSLSDKVLSFIPGFSKRVPTTDFNPHVSTRGGVPELYFEPQDTSLIPSTNEDSASSQLLYTDNRRFDSSSNEVSKKSRKSFFSSGKVVRNTIIGAVGLAGVLAIGYGVHSYLNETNKSTVQSVKKITLPKSDLYLPVVIPVEKDAGTTNMLAEDVTPQNESYDVSTIAPEVVVNHITDVENVPKTGSMNSFPGRVWPVNLGSLENKVVKKEVSIPKLVKAEPVKSSYKDLSLSFVAEPAKEKYAPGDVVTLNYTFSYVKDGKKVQSTDCGFNYYDRSEGEYAKAILIGSISKLIITLLPKEHIRYNNPDPISLELICESEDKQSVSKKFIFNVEKPVVPAMEIQPEIKWPKFSSIPKPQDSQSKYSISLSSGEMCYGCEFKVQSNDKDIELAGKGNCFVSGNDNSFILSSLNSGSKYILSYKIDRKVKLPFPSDSHKEASGVHVNLPISCSFEEDTFTYSAKVKIISEIIDSGSYINIRQWGIEGGKILLKSGEECVGCMVEVDPVQKNCTLDSNSAGFLSSYKGSGIYKLDRNEALGSPNFINYKVVMRCPSEVKGSIFSSLFLNVMKVKYDFSSP